MSAWLIELLRNCNLSKSQRENVAKKVRETGKAHDKQMRGW